MVIMYVIIQAIRRWTDDEQVWCCCEYVVGLVVRLHKLQKWESIPSNYDAVGIATKTTVMDMD